MNHLSKYLLPAFALVFAQSIWAQVPPQNNPRAIKNMTNTSSGNGMSKTNGGGQQTFHNAATNGTGSGTQNSGQTDTGISNSGTGDAGSVQTPQKWEMGPEDVELIKRCAATITAGDMEALLYFIASDELEGRETGTRGQKVAARYLASQFQKIGLQPGNKGKWFQEYNLVRLEVKSAQISFGGKEVLENGKDFVCLSKMSMAAPIDAPLQFAGFGIDDKDYDNLKGLDLKGKVALILNGEPQVGDKFTLSGSETPSAWSMEMGKKSEVLAKKGAVAMVTAVSDEDYKRMVDSPWMKHASGGKSLMLAYKLEENKPFPAFLISESTLNAVLKKAHTNAASLRKLLNVKPEADLVDLSKSKFSLKSDVVKEEVVAENVMGMIEGTDQKDEVVVITAHYDHLGVQNGVVFNGADDDGTGTVSILEIAEAFMEAVKSGHRPRRTILFMPVSGEEKGLLGSEYYSDHPVFPLNKTVCDLNIDMTGRVDEAHKGEPQYIYVIGSDKLSTELHEANADANKIVANLELDYTFNAPDDPNRFYYRSDHYNFAKHNVPVIFYFSGVHEDYHKSTDDLDKILYPRAARVAQLVFATAWNAANRPNKLLVDKQSDMPNYR